MENLDNALADVQRLFFDSAPVIYFVEKNPRYFALVEAAFAHVDNDLLTAVTSAITLAECLVVPYRTAVTQLQQDFSDLIVSGDNTIFVEVDHKVATQAAQLRARYNLSLTDALQIAAALSAGCEAFLTNDGALRRVTELRVLVLDELEI